MLTSVSPVKVYLAVGVTDLRKAINGLSLLVEGEFGLNPFDGSLFVFCNRRRNLLKILYYDTNGFCLFLKRLEQGVFRWPMKGDTPLRINRRELNWLLDGLNLKQPGAHAEISYSRLY